MAKKTETTKKIESEAPAKKPAAAKTKKKAVTEEVKAETPVTEELSFEKKAAAKPAKKAAAPVAKPISFSYEAIATRAYFISEQRRQQGLEADSANDWLEAERQLLAGLN